MVNSFLDFWASSTQHGIRWKTAFLSEQIAEIFSSLYYKLNSFSFLSIKRNNEHNFFFFLKAALAVENTFAKKSELVERRLATSWKMILDCPSKLKVNYLFLMTGRKTATAELSLKTCHQLEMVWPSRGFQEYAYAWNWNSILSDAMS